MTTKDDPLKIYRERIENGEPLITHVIELPFTISLLGDVAVQIDAPLGLAGFEKAAVQRLVLVVPIKMLRGIFEYIENNPDKGPFELKSTSPKN